MRQIKSIPLVLTLILCFLFLLPIQQAVQGAPADIVIKVAGETVPTDVPAYIDTVGRTMVPVRFVSQSLGRIVSWNEELQQVAITGGDQSISLRINSNQAVVNGKGTDLDTKPVIKEGRTMVPIRFIGETLGMVVKWTAENFTVELTPPAPKPVPGRTAVVTDDGVNIRTGPGTSFSRTTQVNHGTILTVLGQDGAWLNVKLPDSTTGWVANWLVRVDGTQLPGREDPSREGGSEAVVPSRFDRIGVVNASNVNIRKGPGTDQPIISMVSTGQRLEVLGQSGEWYQVKIGDQEGYIAGQFVDVREIITAPDDPLAPLEVIKTAVVAQDGLEVKKRPEPAAPVLLKSSRGNRLEIVGEQGAWYQVKVPGGTGWLEQRQVSTMLAVQAGKGTTGALAGKTMVIDPGHGSLQPGDWADPGAVGLNRLMERDVVMDIAWRVSGLLLAEGATVVLTRSRDTSLTLADRAAVGNTSSGNLFVSIHTNASPDRILAGTATYFHKPAGPGSEALSKAREYLAGSIQQELVQKIQRADQGIFEAGFAVIRLTNIPSVLVETAFISNVEEERLLAGPDFRGLVAQGIVNGIKRFLSAA